MGPRCRFLPPSGVRERRSADLHGRTADRPGAERGTDGGGQPRLGQSEAETQPGQAVSLAE